jgi:hypothetical protein
VTEVTDAQVAASGEIVPAITTDSSIMVNPVYAPRALFNQLLIQKKRHDQR